MVIMSLGSFLLFVTNQKFYNFASIDGILDDDDDGSFIGQDTSQDYMSNGCFYMTLQYFLTSILILYALSVQWQIETEFNISRELVLIALVWIILSQLLTGLQTVNNNPFPRDSQSTEENHMSLNEQRWFTFVIFSLRSILCIFITSLDNIVQSFNKEQMILLPLKKGQLLQCI